MSKQAVGKYQDFVTSLKVANQTLYHACNLSKVNFNTTDELEVMTEHLGQSRAMEALKFGIGIPYEGYNLYVLGSTGLGKSTTIKELLAEEASLAKAPSDWCYIHNFEHPHKPAILELPKGIGLKLQQEMNQFIEDILLAIPATFESNEYRTSRQAIQDEYTQLEDRAFGEIADKAEKNNIIMLRNPTGWTLGPKKDNKVLSPEEFEQLPKEEQKAITQVVEEIQNDLKEMLLKIPTWQKASREKVKQLNREVSQMTITQYAKKLQTEYKALQNVIKFIEKITQDIIDNSELIYKYAIEKKSMGNQSDEMPGFFSHYKVNVLVDNSATEGAPIIFEDNPSYQNLIGRIEHIAQFGTLLTNFTLIKPGALHLANGGYLVLDARKVLTSLYSWEGLKRTLRAHEIKIESLEQLLSLASTTSLQPEPIPLNVKVILTGNRLLYYLLKQYDPEFGQLFKVAADFAEDMDRDEKSVELYARMIATLQQHNNLLALDKKAVERVIEHCSRMAEDGEKVSLHMGGLLDLLRESDYWAKQSGRTVVSQSDVQKVIDTRRHRLDQIRERMLEQTIRGTYLINTSGEKVAQVNGLSVIHLDDHAFGRASRITATARLGSGKVIDIEREVELGGAIHSKGVMILSAYLAYRYAKEQPLALSASLVFEQSYGTIEGDSASAAELCALLSALAQIPVKQNLAVTGSVNQHGEIQAIGGVNEKIEGFFDLCQARGLTGDQGVIIPAANQKHLMLKADVVQAIERGEFTLYSVEFIDEVMALLSGITAGELNAKGDYPAESFNGMIQQRILKLTELHEQYAHTENDHHKVHKKR